MADTQNNLFSLDAYGGTAPSSPIPGDILPNHDGETYSSEQDKVRLNAQTMRVYTVMMPGEWMTLKEIAEATGDPEASVSARLRDLRKQAFGSHQVDRRRRGNGGTWEYRMVPK